jgi:tetratricopeptide (TPR) repeat protein
MQTWRAERVLRRARDKLNDWQDSASCSEKGLFQEQSRTLQNIAHATGVPKVFRLVARIRENQGRYDVAMRHLANAAAFDDADQKGHWQLARFLLRRERVDVPPETAATIRTRLLMALRHASRSVDPQIRLSAGVALAKALHQAGDYRGGLTAAEAALEIEAGNPRGSRAKADCLLALGEYGVACSLYSRLIGQNGGGEALARMLPLLERLRDDPAVIAGSEEPGILIGIGGGLGDILHATPTIRNMALRDGAPVDILFLGDYVGAAFLVRNAQYVRDVHVLGRAVLARHYRAVLLLHSFGPWRFPFNTERLVTSDMWHSFRAGRLQETVFNLEAARQLVGIPYEEADAEGYFVGDLEYRAPAHILIGVHAGSKSGRWLSKRWPLFAALAARLNKRGLHVASFGMPDEFVEGTENRTGGSIEEMCRAISECSHFVSNDSGVMHVASALGIPTLALFAPTDPVTHLPLRSTTIGLQLQKDCSPCEVLDHRYFASAACRCIAEIDVANVEARVLEMIAAGATPWRGIVDDVAVGAAVPESP